MNSATLVQKLWNYCNVLRDDGMSYGDYVEQLTYLLFLKMADERSRPPYNQSSLIPADYAWSYNPANRHERKATWAEAPDLKTGRGPDGRWRVYDYDELVARDKASLDIFWLKDDSLADSDNLPPPDVIAQEIVDDLETALEQFRLIAGDLVRDTKVDS